MEGNLRVFGGLGFGLGISRLLLHELFRKGRESNGVSSNGDAMVPVMGSNIIDDSVYYESFHAHNDASGNGIS
jgi:hypothetical protein